MQAAHVRSDGADCSRSGPRDEGSLGHGHGGRGALGRSHGDDARFAGHHGGRTARPPICAGPRTAVFNLACGLAMLIASVVAGILWDQFGAAHTFYAGRTILRDRAQRNRSASDRLPIPCVNPAAGPPSQKAQSAITSYNPGGNEQLPDTIPRPQGLLNRGVKLFNGGILSQEGDGAGFTHHIFNLPVIMH